MKGRSFPALSVGYIRVVGGTVIQNIGVQGDLDGMDTRTLYNPFCPSSASGLHFGGSRVDQGEFSKLSFCGLGVGICVDGNSDVRNCGSMPQGNDETAAAVYIRNVTAATVRECMIDYAGIFWYLAPDATQTRQRDKYKERTVGIRIASDSYRILDNIINHSSDASISVKENQNILNGNIVDGDVVIEGLGNTVSNLIFSQENSKLILVGRAVESTNVLDVPEERILRM